jgi:predicted DNA-binding transcriptional regulator AlpA
MNIPLVRRDSATANAKGATMELLTFDEVAKLEKRTTRGLRKDISAGRFGPDIIRLGRSVRVRASEFRAWVEAGCPSREDWLAMRDAGEQPAGVAR